MNTSGNITCSYRAIGTIHTPHHNSSHTPYQPTDTGENDRNCCIELDEEYCPALAQLDQFKYIYLIYQIDRLSRTAELTVVPPWAGGIHVGLFASRSPLRPNPIGLSIVKLREISSNRIFTSNLDVFDGTPLLDIKPYIRDLDSKADANYGWIDGLPNREHLTLHIKGIPHDY
ncbi:MAG: tRNA (N6-threonylcarbamoyladenosine(37)-N6)-methyltransferase TrmO [Kiritimatiellae bacterium]|nr:tRNA (N6-threonylcarbamoyladenosine(37)-N6)-methyltransferase TrmO [Kiritimatiellia bacterium]